MKKEPKISLVGAGPGDPDLLTIKGLKALQSADVVMYDALAAKTLLREAPPSAHLLYVGKRAGKHSLRQEEINLLMAQAAYRYGHVVRLKGGDPFVFGRGYEELDFARAFNIPVEIVPGISSSIGVPALQKVPLTCRGINKSFWVMTATTSDGDLSTDLHAASRSSATLVILMGMKKLGQIVALFKAAGKHKLPAMVVQNGTTQKEKVALGDISSIEREVHENGLGSPGIIILGEVVQLHPEFAAQLATAQKET